jgi:hypothetical protein
MFNIATEPFSELLEHPEPELQEDAPNDYSTTGLSLHSLPHPWHCYATHILLKISHLNLKTFIKSILVKSTYNGAATTAL